METFFGDFPLTSEADIGAITRLNRADKSPSCLVLHGLGGIGKTQTALEYIYINEKCYDAMFWIEAEHPTTLAATYSDIAESLNLTGDMGGHTGQNQGRAIKKATEWLRSTRMSKSR